VAGVFANCRAKDNPIIAVLVQVPSKRSSQHPVLQARISADPSNLYHRPSATHSLYAADVPVAIARPNRMMEDPCTRKACVASRDET